jgi:hypothetical protein
MCFLGGDACWEAAGLRKDAGSFLLPPCVSWVPRDTGDKLPLICFDAGGGAAAGGAAAASAPGGLAV